VCVIGLVTNTQFYVFYNKAGTWVVRATFHSTTGILIPDQHLKEVTLVLKTS